VQASASIRPSARSSRGFTLLELMVVVAVLAVLAAVATPSMTKLIANQRVRSVAGDLHLALVQARSEAIKRNVQVTLSATGGDWNGGWSIANPEAPATALQTYAAPSGVSIAGSVTQIVYNGTGRTTLGTGVEGTFTVSSANTDSVKCVLVDGTGRPYVKESSAC